MIKRDSFSSSLLSQSQCLREVNSCSFIVLFIASTILITSSETEAATLKDADISSPSQHQEKFKLSGLIMLDADHYGPFFDKNAENSTSNIELRQAKVTAKYKPTKNWKTKLQLKYSYENSENEEFEVGDALVAYSAFSWADITAGKMKEPFSLERLAGSSSLIGIERSMVTTAFAPGRSYGVQVGKNKKSHTWALGVFQEKTDSDSPRSATARATFAPIRKKDQILHLGISASIRDLNSGRFQIKESGEVHTADNIIRSARFDAEKSHLAGIEMAWQYQSLRLQTELVVEDVEQVTGGNWNYWGYYAQASYFITGKSANYKNGIFKQVNPNENVGAVELVSRYSNLDIRDNDLGSESSIAMIGINYYWSKNLKVMANYLVPDISGNTLHIDDSGNAVSVRAQLLF